MNTATSVVSIERRDNVVYLDFSPSVPPPALGEEDLQPAPRIPARYSPRPCRVLARRFARSQLAADLREWAWLVGLLAAGVICVAWLDPSIDLTPAAGGIR